MTKRVKDLQKGMRFIFGSTGLVCHVIRIDDFIRYRVVSSATDFPVGPLYSIGLMSMEFITEINFAHKSKRKRKHEKLF